MLLARSRLDKVVWQEGKSRDDLAFSKKREVEKRKPEKRKPEKRKPEKRVQTRLRIDYT